MPTHAQQVRRRLEALGANVLDESPRGGLNLTALLPAGAAWNFTGTHEIHVDYAGARDAGFTALLGIIKQGTFECAADPCGRCGRTGTADLPTLTFALSGKAMATITDAGDLLTPDPAGDGYDTALRAAAALQAAPRRQRGKGFQFTVTADPAAAAVIADYCQSTGERYAALTGPDDGSVLLTAAERIRDAIRAAAPALAAA